MYSAWYSKGDINNKNLLSVKLAFAILQWSVLIRRSNVTALLHSQRVHYEKFGLSLANGTVEIFTW